MSGAAISFSSDDLAGCVASYDPAKHEAPLVIGHPQIDAPAYGWVQKLHLDGDRMMATAKQVEPAFAELVRAGRFKKVSSSFWSPDAAGNPTPGQWALRHVGFLGAAAPSVKGMKPAHFADGAAGVLDFSDETLLAMQADFDRQARRKDTETFIEKLIGEGRILPVFRDGLASFMEGVDDGSVMSFAENGASLSDGRRAWFKSFLARLPQVVSFGAFPMPPTNDDASGLRAPDGYSVARDSDGHLQRARDYAREHGVSFADAVLKTAGGR
jgi:hypothetical protein